MGEVVRQSSRITSTDGASTTLQTHVPESPRRGVYWLPALGVGIGPNETFADALAEQGIIVAVHEWRGLGSSNRRASRDCDWGYRELLEYDIPAGLAAARAQHADLDWILGGHSLGGQLALLHAAHRGDAPRDVLLVASGHPWWRAFPGWRAHGVRAFSASISLVTAVAGHFPGSRLGFAGREARRLMREWARTCRRGDYRIEAGIDLGTPLMRHEGRVLALCMAQDALAPPASMDHLRSLAPAADWTQDTLRSDHFARRRPDHFGWLREPDAVVAAFLAWSGLAAHSKTARVPRSSP